MTRLEWMARISQNKFNGRELIKKSMDEINQRESKTKQWSRFDVKWTNEELRQGLGNVYYPMVENQDYRFLVEKLVGKIQIRLHKRKNQTNTDVEYESINMAKKDVPRACVLEVKVVQKWSQLLHFLLPKMFSMG